MFSDVILWPREQARYALTAQVDLFVNLGAVRIVDTLPTFVLPADPSWTENPFNSRSWQLYYNSLGWLYAAEEAYKEDRYPGFIEYAKSIILDFMADNPDPSNPLTDMTWHDGANAFRLATISYLYETYFKDGNPNGTSANFTPAESALFLHGLHDMRDQDLLYLSQTKWEDSNHRFFHAMAMASYATVFGNAEGTPFFEPNAPALLTEGLTTVDEILATIVDLDAGVTREQSFMYHRLDLGLVLEAEHAVTDHGFALSRDYGSVIDKMITFDVLARHPTGHGGEYLAPVGDSYYGKATGTSYINDALAERGASPMAEWVLTRGAGGTRPPDLIDYSDAGYIIIRPEYAWENARDTRVLFDVSQSASGLGHGHLDNTNVILSAYGKPILIDSGGPYSYDKVPEMGLNGPFKQLYVRMSPAHNVLVVDGKSFDADTTVNTVVSDPAFSFVSASHAGYTGVSVTRDLLVLKGGPTLVLDVADATGTTSHRYDVNWHFDPSASGVDAAADGEFRIGSVFVDSAFVTSGTAGYEVISGRLGAHPQGWVLPALYTAVPAPVLDVSQTSNDAWFLSAFGESLSQAADLTLSATKTAAGYQIAVAYEDKSWDVTIGFDGSVHVTSAYGDGSVHGTGGNDRLVGTAAADRIFGEAGDDTIYGLDGDDALDGGPGNDTIRAGNGHDSAGGGDGNDIVYGEAGANILAGNGGNDRLVGGDLGRETLDGGDDDDQLYGNGDADKLIGGNGNDRLNGGAGNDVLNGGKGADIVSGGDGNDSIFVDVGNDRYYGDAGNDVAIFKGVSTDFSIVRHTSYVSVTDLNPADGDLGTDTFTAVETFRFNDGDIIVA